MEKHSLIRTIYLYLFALLGLVLLVIGGVGFVNMGLRAFVFTKADQEQRLYNKQPPSSALPIEKLQSLNQQGDIKLSESEKQALDQWLTDYKNWQQDYSKLDPVTSQRHRDASTNLAMILIGLPIYLYHWGVIKKESRSSLEALKSDKNN